MSRKHKRDKELVGLEAYHLACSPKWPGGGSRGNCHKAAIHFMFGVIR